MQEEEEDEEVLTCPHCDKEGVRYVDITPGECLAEHRRS